MSGEGTHGGDTPAWLAVPDHVGQLRPYQPGKPIEELERELGIQGAVKMASNENPLGPSPRAVEAVRAHLAAAHLYPDGSAFALKRALAERLEVAPDELVVGAGSNEIIHLLVDTFCQPGDQVLTHDYAFISYRLAAQARGIEAVTAPVTAELRCDVDALCAAMGPRTRLVFLANPNNPTGAHLRRDELERILEAAPPGALVVVDEAYHEYATALDPGGYPPAQPYRKDVPRLVVLRTFSKIYGLAGLRIGYAVCDRRVAGYIDRVRRPFNASSLAQAAARAALEDTEHVARSVEAARTGLARLAAGLSGHGLTVLPSLGNFVLVGVGREAAPVYQGLLTRGVITRPMGAWGLPRHLRISLGAAAEIDRVIDAMPAVLAG